MPRIHRERPAQRRHPARASALLGLALLAVSGPARAQPITPPEPPDATQPPAADHAFPLAAARFEEGTTLFKQWRFEEAEERFREALAHWEHPLIHLYLGRALEKQGRLVEAHEALQQALRPGVEPLPPEDVQVAEALRQRLVSQLAQLEVHCDVPGAELSLDGERWFTAPGRPLRMVAAGRHVLLARKPGYFPVAERVSLMPGERARFTLRMTADVIHVERRWRPWQPWAVAGAGVATSLAGGLLLWQARSAYAAIQGELDACDVGEPSCRGIAIPRIDRTAWKARIGTGALIAGGSVLAAGLAGVVLNLPRSRRSEPARGLEKLDIVPMLSGDTAGISARMRF